MPAVLVKDAQRHGLSIRPIDIQVSNRECTIEHDEDTLSLRLGLGYASADAPPGQSESEVAKQLFPDQATYKREENRRWELTTNHWDLPIHIVNTSAE